MMKARNLASGLLLAAATLSFGCGGDSPAAPEEPEATPRTTLTLDFSHVEVIEDCDGIEGVGDFSFLVRVNVNGGRFDDVYDAFVNLGPGGKTPTIGRRSYTFDATDGTWVAILFHAWEYDTDGFSEWHDERLRGEAPILDHVFDDGAWSGLGPQSLSKGGADCLVRLSWSAHAS